MEGKQKTNLEVGDIVIATYNQDEAYIVGIVEQDEGVLKCHTQIIAYHSDLEKFEYINELIEDCPAIYDPAYEFKKVGKFYDDPEILTVSWANKNFKDFMLC